MQINKKYETEIDLRDLFFHICYRWRSLIVAAVIGAILLGAYQYWSVWKTHNEGKQTKDELQYEIDLQNYKDSLRNTRNNVRTYTKLIKEKNDYLDESVYLTLDSQNEWLAYKRFYIKMDQAVLDALPESATEDPADYVASVYTSTLKSKLDFEKMKDLLGTDKLEYINELVSVWSDGASNTVTVQVVGADEETVTEQLDYFVNRLLEVSQPQAQLIGAHTLTLINEDTYSRTDSGLSAKQDEINQQILEWQEELKTQRETLNDLEDQEEPQAPGNHVKKFAAIGFILGAILLAGIYAVKYVLGGRLHAAGELSERYGLPVYGDFATSRARRPGKGLDKLFEKWEFKHAITDADTVESSIGALLSERFAGKKLLLTGTVSDQKLADFAGDLKRKLNGACELTVQGDLPINADVVAALKDADAVVLVEAKNESRSGDIERAAELLNIGEANVVGCIVL